MGKRTHSNDRSRGNGKDTHHRRKRTKASDSLINNSKDTSTAIAANIDKKKKNKNGLPNRLLTNGIDKKISMKNSANIDEVKWSKSKKKRMRKLMAKLKKEENMTPSTSKDMKLTSTSAAEEERSEPLHDEFMLSPSTTKKSSSIQDAFKARLVGSRFRILNEELYTTTSKESFGRFSSNPDLFKQYHEGFRYQVSSWPENPVNVIVKSLTSSLSSLLKNKSSSNVVVADFGCGDAQLAKDLLKVHFHNEKCPFTVYSFDLVAPNEFVTACDMANVPLPDKSVDICVFCLSLMGTNLADFIREAHRVLKDNGRVKIAEVRSRIEHSHSRKGIKNEKTKDIEKTEGTLNEFLHVLDKLGFECVKTDRSNTMFLLLELKKNGKVPDKKLTFTAKPCIYKRR